MVSGALEVTAFVVMLKSSNDCQSAKEPSTILTTEILLTNDSVYEKDVEE